MKKITYINTAVLLCAIALGLVVWVSMSDAARRSQGFPNDGRSESAHGMDRKPRQGKKSDYDKVAKLELGEKYGSYIGERRVALPDLQVELESLKKRLGREVFFQVMTDFGKSNNYLPEEKARIFNKLLPIGGNSAAYPVYQDVMLDWVGKGESGDQFWIFVGQLESSEIREYLTRGYYASSGLTLEGLEEIVKFEADRESESFLGRDYQSRSRSLAQVVDSLIASKKLTQDEVDGMLSRLDIDVEFKMDLTARLVLNWISPR